MSEIIWDREENKRLDKILSARFQDLTKLENTIGYYWVEADDKENARKAVIELEALETNLKQVEANYDALQTPMPCGHLARYAVNEEEGTQYCVMCHVSNLDGTIDVLHKTLHEIALGLDECEGCTCEMGNAPNGQPYHAIGCTETLAIIARRAIGEQ